MNNCKRRGSCCNAIALAVYRAWAAQGITVVAHDSQGHGRSKGDDPKKHVWMDNFQRWVDDVYQVRKVCFHFKLLDIHFPRGENAAVSALANTVLLTSVALAMSAHWTANARSRALIVVLISIWQLFLRSFRADAPPN